MATHGKLASGYEHTLKMFLPNANVTTFEYYTEENDHHSLEDELLKIKDQEICLIFTDILGGSVTQEVIKYIDLEKVFLITGFNLALLLELLTTDENLLTTDFIEKAIVEARNQMVLVNKYYRRGEIYD